MRNTCKAKKTIKEQADTLASEKKYLFGQKFETHVVKTVKSKEKSKDLFRSVQPILRKASLSLKGEVCKISTFHTLNVLLKLRKTHF